MSNASNRKNRRKQSTPSASSVKGKVLEDLVARLYEAPDLTVATRQFLPVRTNPTRTREIDVLVTGSFAGHPMRIAIECKNHRSPVGVGLIDAFIGKLKDVGIPYQQGIFITTSGFEGNAVPRAQEVGIRTLVLSGLTPERLSEEVREALQSVVYLLPVIQNLRVTTQEPVPDDVELLWFTDEDGKVYGGVIDLVWAAWRDGGIPRTLGEHQVTLPLADRWRWSEAQGGDTTIASTVVKVVGLVVTESGAMRSLVLNDAGTGAMDRGKIEMSFPQSEESLGVRTVETEADLDALFSESRAARVTVGMVPLPKVLYNFYWPPSAGALAHLQYRGTEAFIEAYRRWKITHERLDPTAAMVAALESATFAEVEGTILNRIWDPIDPTHPAAQDPDRWPFDDSTTL